MCVRAAAEAFLTAIESGRALNKWGRKYKPSAVDSLRGALNNYVVPALGTKRLGVVRRGDVQHLIDDLDCSGSHVRKIVNAIRSLYGWAQDRELVDHDPASRVRLPAMDATPRDRVATVAEMAQLLAALEITDALPFAIAVYTTARRNEIRHLDLDDVDLDLGVIYLGTDGNARKSRASQRPFPIVKPLRTIIRRAQLARAPGAGRLLCPGRKPGGRNSGMLSFEALQIRVDGVWEKAKLTRITPHECKHTAVSWLEAAGVRQVVISMLAGHALQHGGAHVTARYTHALPGDLERARDLFDAYLAREAGLEATG
jgi:integrase